MNDLDLPEQSQRPGGEPFSTSRLVGNLVANLGVLGLLGGLKVVEVMHVVAFDFAMHLQARVWDLGSMTEGKTLG